MEIKINKAELLGIVKANRETHHTVFLEALEGYRKAVIAELEKALDDARSGKRIWRATGLTQPINQVAEYDRAIRMIELSVDEHISLEEDEFAQLVLDKWAWSRSFSASNKSYVASALAVDYTTKMEEG
jgi:hypothetical protein